MVTSTGRAVDSIKHCEKRISNLTQIIKDSRPEAFYYASECTQICATRFFFCFLTLVIVKDQSSHLVDLNICSKYQSWENLNSIGCRSCEIIMEEKTPLSSEVVCFQMLNFGTSKSNSEVSKSNLVENYFFLKTCVTSEGAVSHNVLCYQQLHCSLPSKFLC